MAQSKKLFSTLTLIVITSVLFHLVSQYQHNLVIIIKITSRIFYGQYDLNSLHPMILDITEQDTLIPSSREILGSTLFFAFLGVPLSFLTVIRWLVNFCLSLRWTFTNIVVILITISALSCIFLAGADRSGRSNHTHDQTWYNKYQRCSHLSSIPSEDEVVRTTKKGRAAAIHSRGRHTHR